MKLVNVVKKYKKNVVFDNLNLEFNKAGIYIITGRSGSGKTTLFNMLYGIDTNFSGEYYIGEQNIKKTNLVNQYNDNIAMVFQDTKLIDNLTVIKNLEIANKYDTNIEELLTEFNILDLKDEKVKFLSGGEKQRVAIIRSILNNPSYILLDEPTSALDDNNTEFIVSTLKKLSIDKVIIIITHDERLSVHANYLYKLENNNITKVDDNEIIGIEVEIKKVKKNKNSLLPISLTNLIVNKKTLIPTGAAIFVATILLTLICLKTVPNMIEEVKEYIQTGPTTEINYHPYDEKTMQPIEMSEAQIQEVEAILPEGSSISYSDIVEYLSIFGTTKAVVQEEILYAIGFEPGDKEFDNALDQPLNLHTSVQPYGDASTIDNLIGEYPTNKNEIIVPTEYVIAKYNTTNYQSVIGEEVELTFEYSYVYTEEEYIKLEAEAMANGTEVETAPVEYFSRTFTITGVYTNAYPSTNQKDNFMRNYEQMISTPEEFAGFDISFNLYTHVDPFMELSSSDQQKVVEYQSYVRTEEYEVSDFETGITGFHVALPGDKDSNSAIINELNNSSLETSQIYAFETTKETILLQIGIFLAIFAFGAIMISIVLICLNLMNLKARRDEFAKYYLIGLTNHKIINSFALELTYLNIILVPTAMFLTIFIYKAINPTMLLSNLLFSILFIIFSIIIMNLCVVLWFKFANRRKKILKNLREAK